MCGKGLAANAALPEILSRLMGVMAEVLDRHTRALDPSEPAGKAELEAYKSLVTAQRPIAESLARLAQEMAGYRDLPMAAHDPGVMQDPSGQAEAFARLVAVEAELAELLRARAGQGS